MFAISLPVSITFLAVLAGVPEEPEPSPGVPVAGGGNFMRFAWSALPWAIALLAVAVVFFFIYRARRMDIARRELEARLVVLNSEREHLMAMLANDLNNPLQTIRLACDSLGASALDEKTVTMLRQTVERMTRLVKNVLNTTALQSGQAKFEAREVELSNELATILAAMQLRAEVKQITLSFHSGPGRVRVDVDALAQVMDEIVGNALKFTPRGGRIAVTVQREGRHIEIRVGDSGPGIGADELARLFTKNTGGKHGLANARMLVEGMDGIIFAESQPGVGATIRVRLPEVAAA